MTTEEETGKKVVNIKEFKRQKEIKERKEKERIDRAKILEFLLNDFRFDKSNGNLLRNMCGGDLEFCLLVDLLYAEKATVNFEQKDIEFNFWYTLDIDNLLFFNNFFADEFKFEVRMQILKLAFNNLKRLNFIDYKLYSEKIEYCLAVNNILDRIYLETSKDIAIKVTSAWWKREMRTKKLGSNKFDLYFKNKSRDFRIKKSKEDKVNKFEKALIKILRNEFKLCEYESKGKAGEDYIKLSTEYGPSRLLRLAIKNAGISRIDYPEHRKLIVTPEAVITYGTLISSNLSLLDRNEIKFIYFTREFIERAIDNYKELNFGGNITREERLEIFKKGKRWLDKNDENFYIHPDFNYIDTGFFNM